MIRPRAAPRGRHDTLHSMIRARNTLPHPNEFHGRAVALRLARTGQLVQIATYGADDLSVQPNPVSSTLK